MPDLFDLVSKWWKHILFLLLISLAVTFLMVSIAPKRYVGIATALPAPTYGTDKLGVFGENVETLYPGIGTADDLDFVLGTARLDTVYSSAAADLKLVHYYKVDPEEKNASKKAGLILKGKTKVYKSDFGELKVKCWDANAAQAADMANTVMQKLQQIHQDVQTANNRSMLNNIGQELVKLKADYQALKDSMTARSNSLLSAREQNLVQQIQEYERLQRQYSLMVNAKPQALIITESASPGLWPDKPKPKRTLLAAAVLSLFFGLLVALILERRRMIRS